MDNEIDNIVDDKFVKLIEKYKHNIKCYENIVENYKKINDSISMDKACSKNDGWSFGYNVGKLSGLEDALSDLEEIYKDYVEYC